MSEAQRFELSAIPRAVPNSPEHRLEQALDALDATAFPFGLRIIKDAAARDAYRKAIQEAVAEIRAEVAANVITAEQGAAQAVAMRNQIMNVMRDQSSDVGRAWAEFLKRQGKTLEALTEHYAQQLCKKTASALTAAERDLVMREIIAAAARDNKPITTMLRVLRPASRALMALTIGLAVYEVYQSPDPAKEAAHQGVLIGAGVAGSYVGGAIATSLVCGPGAPVCLAIFVVAGGIAFAAGADYFWKRGDPADGHR